MTVIATITAGNKSFKQQQVLTNVSFEVAAGQILGLIGPSGAGKSTAIKCLLGMEKLDSGSSNILNTTMPNRKILGQIGYMGQSDALYEELTALENIHFFGQLMGLEKAVLQKAARQQLALVDLTNFSNERVKNFSGGMKRRLSLAITLLADPALLVLDEPTVGIDPKLRQEIWQELRRLAQNKKGILITTHVMDEAEKCDVIGLIIKGRLFALDTPQNLKTQFHAATIEEVFLKAEVVADAL